MLEFGQAMRHLPQGRLIALNKPYGTVSQFTPLAGHPTLAELNLPKGFYPAGRLDHDSEGLLLLTNDGRLHARLVGSGHPRTYLAQVERLPSPEALARLAKGLRLKDGMTRPCGVRLLDREPSLPPRIPPIRHRLIVPTAWLELVLTEGKNRQIRRMTAAIGHPTLRLLRIRSGSVELGDLEPGRWRWENEKSVNKAKRH